ncbi:hypothetical protein BRLA_c002450 [Brevibacillus laterosporus LMG 15441]|uniref:Uncharacterized protein n=1 Tax=Brevibacillus laterosporus LMG 15441 TaxID=1042163 RepID=A0A075R4U3_BRELA|nr:hypothetical protein BRLA_c002450 [Brevibacillus laterosporus LMG 15441]
MKKIVVATSIILASLSLTFLFSIERQTENQIVSGHIKVYTGDPGH